MSYARPSASAADTTWLGALAYVRPSAGAADAAFPSASVIADAVARVTVGPVLTVATGSAVSITAVLPVVAEIAAETARVETEADIAAAVVITATIFTHHGVAGTAVAAVTISGGSSAAHGVSATGGARIPVIVNISALHERYELRGEVREGGVLVNRRVRAYLRSSGILLGQADTVAGKFNVPAGFAAAECYVTPIDLSDSATDWLPPTANRVTSVLAQDTA